MSKLILIFFVFTYSIALCNTYNTSNSFFNIGKEKDKESFKINMAKAWMKYNDEDYRGALRIYRSLYEDYPESGILNYRMGECFLALKEMGDALKHLEIALKNDTTIDKNAYFYIGQAYQYEGKLDDAINNYYKFKTLLTPKQLEKHYVNELWTQCHTAKELMASPVDVKITNLGKNINSEFTDACPSVSADGKVLIFTSRRPETTGGLIEPANEEYYDDIYMSTYSDATKTWELAKQMPSPINTEGHDANTSISPDGNTIFIYKNITGVTKSGDIYYSTKKGPNEWSEPLPVDEKLINGTYFESSACITTDGNTMFFVSERLDGYGNSDIYTSKKEGTNWGKPVNIGSVINSIDDEIGVFIHPDGKTLFFSSNGHNTMGGYDIFMSVFKDGIWSTPVNMGYPINTTKDEIHFVLSTDGKTAYISSSREGGLGKTDIYQVDMTNYYKDNKNINKDLVDKLTGPVLSILKGSIVDAETSLPVVVELIINDTDENKEVARVSSNEKGEYFITLQSEKKYELVVNSNKYKPLDIKFKLPKGIGETYTLTKHILLNKK